jgi:hypothetical protein
MTAHGQRSLGLGSAHDRQGGRAVLALAAGAVVAGSVLLSLRDPAIAAPPNQLLNPDVFPSDATTKATFTFAVTYESAEGNEPSDVTAIVGTTVIPLTLEAGSPANGRYRGSAKLPAGTWKVLFHATVAHRNDPSLNGPTIRVRPVSQPLASPAPTARPAPQTTEARTPRPDTDEPTHRPHASAASPGETSPVGAGIVTPSSRATPDPSLGGAAPRLSPLETMVAGALIALAALALIGLFAFLIAWRRRRRDTRLVLPQDHAREMPASTYKPAAAIRKPAKWQPDWALDDAPTGAVESKPPAASEPPDEEGA